MSKEVARLFTCQVIMPATVELKVGDLLQYAPRKENSESAELSFTDKRLGMMVKIESFLYGVDETMQRVADYHPTILAETYLSLEKLKFGVKFQDERKDNAVTFEQQTKIEFISAVHFWNMDPLQSAI